MPFSRCSLESSPNSIQLEKLAENRSKFHKPLKRIWYLTNGVLCFLFQKHVALEYLTTKQNYFYFILPLYKL